MGARQGKFELNSLSSDVLLFMERLRGVESASYTAGALKNSLFFPLATTPSILVPVWALGWRAGG